jgi:hypothetical protein
MIQDAITYNFNRICKALNFDITLQQNKMVSVFVTIKKRKQIRFYACIQKMQIYSHQTPGIYNYEPVI